MRQITLALSRVHGDYICITLATDVPFIACVINSLSTFTYYLDLSNFILEFGLSYFRVSTICPLLVYFVRAAGCHCFELLHLLTRVFQIRGIP